jgi:hypothetical protein
MILRVMYRASMLIASGFLVLSCVTTNTGIKSVQTCGAPLIDGSVNMQEWDSAWSKKYRIESPSRAGSHTLTLYVTNDDENLYLGVTVDDDEFSTRAQYLPIGDAIRIDFDDDRRNALFTKGENVVIVGAGTPQYGDYYIVGGGSKKSASEDDSTGGTLDGEGAASRIGDLNHFEVRIPLCSGDGHDICVHADDTLAFQIEYLDGEAGGEFGGSYYCPAFDDSAMIRYTIVACLDM